MKAAVLHRTGPPDVLVYERHLDAIAAGELRVFIDRRCPLADVAAAHADCESRAAFGRVLLLP